jgi:hypothetical protein
MVRQDQGFDIGLFAGIITLSLITGVLLVAVIVTLPERCGSIPHDRNGEVTGPRVCQLLGAYK